MPTNPETMTQPSDYDIAICGAGPVGTAFALMLAETWPEMARIALIDGRSVEDAARDDRMIAISQGSRMLLERLHAWHDANATPIHHIHVSQRGHFGRTLIDRNDYDLPALGYVIRYGDLVQQLNKATEGRGFTVLRPALVEGIKQNDTNATITVLANDIAKEIQAAYAVHAEGGLFQAQAKKSQHRDYGQTAITSFVTTALPQADTAWERFTEDGPIALLPCHHNGQSGYALVWCCSPEDAARRMQMSTDVFLDDLHRQFGDRLGRFTSVAARKSYPLGLNAIDTLAAGREFAIGNAAQTLHPVAGQGFNLGLRDAYTLAEILRKHFNHPDLCTQQFNAARRLDRAATIRLTDALPRIFSSKFFPVIASRGISLALLDALPPLRHVLGRQMMNGQR